MREEIRPINPAAEASTPERCFVLGISDMATDPEASIARVRVQTGVTTRWHLLDGITERYVLLSGSGSAEIGSLPATAVGPGDFVLIPSGCHRRITNTGCEDLVFLAICTPQFQAGAYRDVDPAPKASDAAGPTTPWSLQRPK